MICEIDNSLIGYRKFLRIKSLPAYRFRGSVAEFPDEYSDRVLGEPAVTPDRSQYAAIDGLFDYQRDISAIACRKMKYCVFADCGLGKTLILLEWERHVASLMPDRPHLIVCPLMVVRQTVAEARRFYGDGLPIQIVPASKLQQFLETGSGIGITNYEAIHEGLRRDRLASLALDESSMLKSHYGKFGSRLIELGRGLDWKLCLTGTPAPNDRIEFANHAVFMDAYPNVNAFLARFFINRGQTQERWVLKPHAVRAFYRSLSHWCIFLTNPATYGWKDNCGGIPPIHVHIHSVPLTTAQRDAAMRQTGSLITTNAGGIVSRSALARLAKTGDSLKPKFIRDLVDSWPTESTIIWCLYNQEQDAMDAQFPLAASIRGATTLRHRETLLDDFLAGTRKQLISKPKVLGFGLNLQVATRHVFSGLQDSYESYYQAVKRSNRVGSKQPLNVHIPLTELEVPGVNTVLEKAKRVEADTREQEALFRESQEIA